MNSWILKGGLGVWLSEEEEGEEVEVWDSAVEMDDSVLQER